MLRELPTQTAELVKMRSSLDSLHELAKQTEQIAAMRATISGEIPKVSLALEEVKTAIERGGADLTGIATLIGEGKSKEEIMAVFPQETVHFGTNISELCRHSRSEMNTERLNAHKSLAEALRSGKSVESLLMLYPEIVVQGAYDLIHLDKWLRTKVFPS
jgi:uncharacterized protein (DUF433 family)